MGYSYGYGYGHTWRPDKRVTAAVAVGGAALLVGETDGFATDFLYAVDAKRVAVKATNVVTSYAIHSFYVNTGTSPKQVWDVSGTLVWSPHNYYLRSQEFDNAAWTVSIVTVTGNAIVAPDGTTTADRIVEAAVNSNHLVYPAANLSALVVGETYRLSVYAKAGERNWLALQGHYASTSTDFFDLTNGVMGTVTAGATMESVGNGWYRCSILFVQAAGSQLPGFCLKTANGQTGIYLGDVTKGLYLWGAMVSRGTTLHPYLPTTTAARFGLALDYDPVTHAPKGLLCEPAATNLVYYSNDQTAAGWITTSGTVARDVVAPNGQIEGTTFTEAAATSQHAVLAPGGYRPTLTAATYTFSVFLKAGTRRYVFFGPDNAAASGFFVTVDTTNWTIVNSGNIGTGWVYASSSIQDVGGGWKRVSITGTTTAVATIMYVAGNNTALGGRSESYLGNGSTIICWGVQIETGSIASSPVPTFAASVTRIKDSYNVTPASINYSTTAGSWWTDVNLNAAIVSGRIIGYSSAHGTYVQSATAFTLYDGAGISTTVSSSLGANKISFAFQSGDRAVTAAGVAPTTSAVAGVLLGTPGALIGFGYGPDGSANMNGYIRQVRYVPRRKTNAEIVTETT